MKHTPKLITHIFVPSFFCCFIVFFSIHSIHFILISLFNLLRIWSHVSKMIDRICNPNSIDGHLILSSWFNSWSKEQQNRKPKRFLWSSPLLSSLISTLYRYSSICCLPSLPLRYPFSSKHTPPSAPIQYSSSHTLRIVMLPHHHNYLSTLVVVGLCLVKAFVTIPSIGDFYLTHHIINIIIIIVQLTSSSSPLQYPTIITT